MHWRMPIYKLIIHSHESLLTKMGRRVKSDNYFRPLLFVEKVIRYRHTLKHRININAKASSKSVNSSIIKMLTKIKRNS